MKPPYAIGSVPSLSSHAIAYRWRSLPRVRRHRASKPQGSSERVLPWQVTMDQLLFASLSHTHYWYEVGMLKVPAVCGWCLAYCTGVVLNTVRESTTPDSKENKQADAGSRRFRRHFLCGALLCNFSSTEHEGLSTHVQRECSAEPFMRSILSLRIFTPRPGSRLRFFIKCKFSSPTGTPLYSSIIRLYPQNPVFKIVHDEIVKVLSTNVQRKCSAEPSMRRILYH